MTENQNTLKFLSACDELITGKFLVAENKIQKVLGLLAETPQVYSLVAECMEHFNRDRELGKAFVQGSGGKFLCIMPDEEYKVIALVFCTLADINVGKINFMEFVKRFFSDEGDNPYKRFISIMIIPFRNLIAEAFSFPKIELAPKQDQIQAEEVSERVEKQPVYVDEDMANKILKFPTVRNLNRVDSVTGLEKLCVVCQRICGQMLDELESLRRDAHTEELLMICYALIMATADQDLDMLRALTYGLKYAGKGVKSIKYLVRELEENIERFINALEDND